MSLTTGSEAATLPVVTSDNFLASTDPVAPDGHFAAHHHAHDQLAWAQHGGMRVRVDNANWRVTPEQFVWIPAHADHEMWMEGCDAVMSLYLAPSLRPRGERWRRALVLPVDDLAGTVVRHLCAQERALDRRRASVVLLRDVLEHTVESTNVLAMPAHPVARRIAAALIADPASDRTLADWAEEQGVSTKTLVRAFAADGGMTFGQWRTRARVYRAAQLLSEGWRVQEVAPEVGYATTTGFIKAYRSVHQTTPAAHVTRQRH